MTTKEIADAVGRPEKTVRTWAAKAAAKTAEAGAKLAEAQKSGGKPADWNLDETCQIIEIGLGKNAASLYRENARQGTALKPTSESSLTAKDIEMIGALTASIVSKVMANLDNRVSTIEQKVSERAALLPAPAIKPRDNINKIVRDYAARTGGSFRDAWAELYREYGYRTNSNPSLSARNRGMTILDYIEVEGHIGVLEAVAVDVFTKKVS